MTDRQDRSDARAGKAEDRLDALETESHDEMYAEERVGHGGHEDRIEQGRLRLDALEALSDSWLGAVWRNLVPAIALGLALLAFTGQQGQVNRNSRRIDTLAREAELRGSGRDFRQCDRVQVLRGKEANPLAAIVYLVLESASRSNSSARAAYGALLPLLAAGTPTDCKRAGKDSTYPGSHLRRLTRGLACRLIRERAHELGLRPRLVLCRRA